MVVPLFRSVRFWFSLAVALISAAVTDPLLEAASNAGIFGHGAFTDHSNLDVLPALCVGLVAIAVHVGLRVNGGILRSWDSALRARAGTLLPMTFAAQLIVLYSMETIEQIAVTGHPLGGAIWLGAPAAIAIAVHAVTCIIAFFVATRVMHELAWATLRVVRIIRAILTREAARSIIVRRLRIVLRTQLAPELCTAGGRAPPSYAR